MNSKHEYHKHKEDLYQEPRQIKYRKGIISPESPFQMLQANPSSGFIQPQALNNFLPCLTP